MPEFDSSAPYQVEGPGAPQFDASQPFEVAPTTSNGQRMEIDFNNQQQAAGQRTSPIVSAHEKNLIGPAMQNDAGDIGYKGPDGSFVPTDQNKHVVLTDPNDNTPKVYSRTDSTDEGAASSLGRLIGTGMGAGNIEIAKAAPAAMQAAQAASRIGVDVPRAIATDSPLVKFTGQLISKAPGGGPLNEAIPKSIGQLGESVGRAADLAGGVTDPMAAGAGFKSGVTNSFEPAITQRLKEAYDRVGQLIDPNATSKLTNTSNLVDELNAARAARGKGPSAAVGLVQPALEVKAAMPSGNITAAQYQDFVKGGQSGLTYDAIKNLRTDVGETLAKTPDGTSQTELKRLYGSLSEDLKAHVSQVGGTQAVSAFESANRLNKVVQVWRETLAPILGSDIASGESITASLLRKASVGPTGDVRALAVARASVPKEAWRNIASTAISTLGKSRNGEWSPAAFLTDYRKISDQGKGLLFSSIGSGNVVPFLNDIADVSNKFVQAGKLANTSGTAGHNIAYTLLGAAGTGLAHGSLVEPVTAATGVFGINVMARILAAPATASSMAKWSNAYLRLAQNPGPSGLAAFNRISREFAGNVKSAIGVSVDPSSFMKAIQSPMQGAASQNGQEVPGHPAQ